MTPIVAAEITRLRHTSVRSFLCSSPEFDHRRQVKDLPDGRTSPARKRFSLVRRFRQFPGEVTGCSGLAARQASTFPEETLMSCRTAVRSVLAIAATLLLSVSANAQLFRAYLASTGSDTNDCTRPTPCRLLPAALNVVADGGEIWMLDSANYNTATVTIGKSVSILAVPGAVGSVLAIGSPAISITAAGLKVALRNLVVVPLAGGGATDGISMTGASSLTIEHSLVANLPGSGVYVLGAGKLRVAHSIFRNNTGYAVLLANGAVAEISQSQLLGNVDGGVLAYGYDFVTTLTTASVSDSSLSGGTYGVHAYTVDSSATARIFVTRCTIEGAGYAMRAETNATGTATVTVSSSMIVNNNFAWRVFELGSVIRTLGNNHFSDNATSSGVLTALAAQ
jgi:hypothetical protein